MRSSNALYPVTSCILTRSVEAMSVSEDFYNLFKSVFKLSKLGLWWCQARTAIKEGTQYSRSKFVLNVKIDNKNISKVPTIEEYYSKSSKKVDDNLLGVPISSSNETKNRIIDNSKLKNIWEIVSKVRLYRKFSLIIGSIGPKNTLSSVN